MTPNLGVNGKDTPMKDNYEFYRRYKALEEKTRIKEIQLGQVPLRRGKWGMDVEEYLEHVRYRELQYRYDKLCANDKEPYHD